jgi:hypothetical protein
MAVRRLGSRNQQSHRQQYEIKALSHARLNVVPLRSNLKIMHTFYRTKALFFPIAGNALFLGLVLGLLSGCVSTSGQQGMLVSTVHTPGAFTLAASGKLAPIVVSGEDFEGVLRAAGDLQSDLMKVTGTEPELVTLEEGVLPGAPSTGIVLAGTLGKSGTIGHLVETGKLNVEELEGRWESSLTRIVEDPFPGIDRAVVICGSDKRGTIYGIYELAAAAGVSPWHFWADVTPLHREALYVNNGRFLLGEPAVRYRGIFINDEAPALAGWAEERYGGFNMSR